MNTFARKTAYTGVVGALAVGFLVLASTVPTGRISMYVLASFMTAVIIPYAGYRYGLILYVGVSLLAVLLLPNKPLSIPYIGFFGWYGLAKIYAEAKTKGIVRAVIKFGIFNAAVGILFVSARQIDLIPIDWEVVQQYIWLGWIILQIGFIIYDIVFTLCLDYFERRVLRKIRH